MPQRRVTIESDGASLEGVVTTPDGAGPFPAVVICHPHPQYGGSMHNNVVAAVASSVVARGIAAVMFNFRGVGGSDGVPGDQGEARTDATTVLAYAAALDDVDGDRVGLAGYSFGAGTAVGGAGEGLPALALVSLPLMMAEGAHDTLAAYSGPLLLISGSEDEGSNEAGLQALAESCAGEATVRVVAGADHFWWGDEYAIEQAVGPFFASALAG
ncbi:MAG: hypothetical protein F4Z60_02920 [Chloroflexi bacterium]|nr:hypothetical protein [Chloroflexota bacterium]